MLEKVVENNPEVWIASEQATHVIGDIKKKHLFRPDFELRRKEMKNESIFLIEVKCKLSKDFARA